MAFDLTHGPVVLWRLWATQTHSHTQNPASSLVHPLLGRRPLWCLMLDLVEREREKVVMDGFVKEMLRDGKNDVGEEKMYVKGTIWNLRWQLSFIVHLEVVKGSFLALLHSLNSDRAWRCVCVFFPVTSLECVLCVVSWGLCILFLRDVSELNIVNWKVSRVLGI